MTESNSRPDITGAAHDWHRAGYRLVAWPREYGKAPQEPGWGLRAVDPASVRPDHNIGCNHALSGTACVDVDHVESARVVFEYLGLDVDALVASTLAYTGRPGRLKLMFRAIAPAMGVRKLRIRMRSDDSDLTTVMELRGAADGKQAQDVLPPSIHPDTGEPYRLLTPVRAVSELPDMPPALVDLWQNWSTHEKALKRVLGDADAARVDDKARNPRGHDDVIGAFNGRFSVGEILERNGYASHGPRRWLRPGSTTGVPGVVLMAAGDAVWSFGGGALADARPHDAFDCYRILEHHDDTRAAVRAAADVLGISRAANDDTCCDPRDPAGWPNPGPLPDKLLPVARFDVDLLPDAVRGYVVDVAERMQCPVDYPAVVQMTMLGGLLGRRVGILPKRHDDWYVVPNLWGFIVGRPSMMKSPVISAILEPVRQIEQEAAKQFTADRAESVATQIVSDALRKVNERATQDAARKGELDKAREHARLIAQAGSSSPRVTRYTTSDATVEKLGELLSENPNGLILLRDELTGFFRTFERQGHEGDRAFYLECWNGTQPYTTDRILRGTVHVPAACVSILGGIQPGPLAALVREMQGTGDDGLLQRFQMVAFPDVPAAYQLVDRYPDLKARALAFGVAARFATLAAPIDDAHPGPIPLLRFNEGDGAQAAFLNWLEQHERRMRTGADHPAVESHLTKYKKLVPALALIMQLCDHDGGPVSRDAIERAIRWAAYLESHARRVYSPATRPEVDAAHALADRITRGELGDRFTARDVYGKGWSALTDTGHTKTALALLTDAGWLEHIRQQTDGRPSDLYLVNPRIRRAAP
jgi:putative DNA primase/helicase